ncbi:hypothetical protein [Chryseobacterium sp.]|uniref:hypothetical protein n=1 Tax=Chryseobacterium sp. TaxID=1871047 RepID=UPI000EBD4CCE|nr:hypothetical protein [Chryseobacterium sp.]HCA06794.1 hypothetical protein [Chryseobacterium sp.]
MTSIKLKDYTSYVKSGDKFRKDLFKSLGDMLFSFSTLDEVIFSSLKCIYPINKSVKNTPVSIENHCGKVLEHFQIRTVLDAKLIDIDTKRIISDNTQEKLKSCKQRYLENILMLKEIPKYNYTNLKINVENHLKNIITEINYYDSLKFISDFKKDNINPSSQQEKTYLNYYLRCINEQQKILNYLYSNDIKDRAIFKSTKHLIDIPYWNNWYYNDYPYKSAFPNSKQYFNHNYINRAEHRLGEFPISMGNKLDNLYMHDKEKFYKRYFKTKPVKEIIGNINYYLSVLPLNPNRAIIIKELISLFNQKKWSSFYITSLSQVEGIFNDMIQYVVSSKRISQRSLFYKVDGLREFHNLSESYFDYFQYYIPELRNKFMHGGIDNTISNKINSYDLLTDLLFLLKVFYELDSPYIQLIKTINKSEFVFSTIEDVTLFVTTTKSLSNEHYKELKEKLNYYLIQNLIDTCHFEQILIELEESLPKTIEKLKDLALVELFINLEKDSFEKIKNIINSSDKKKSFISNLKYIYESERTHIQQSYLFYKYHKRYLPFLDTELKDKIENIFKISVSYPILEKWTLIFEWLEIT